MAEIQIFRRVSHACRKCLGPILQTEDGFVCAVCDAAGARGEEICGCGISAGEGGRKNLSFRCIPNPERGPASPAAVVIAFGATRPVDRGGPEP
ncbi:MAG TPA: hypothetical protein VMJ64_00360 [Anaerolineales bacterium]|nr:hypothetical protein [Anaerolineales bacterium]